MGIEYVKKFCLLGDGPVGKTSLVRRYVYDVFEDKYISTIGTKVTKKTVSINSKELGTTPILWLSDAEKEYAVAPEELSKLYYELVSFLKKAKNSFILLVGLEYLVSNNSFKSVLKFLQLLKDQIAIHNSSVIITVSTSNCIGEGAKAAGERANYI